MWNMVLPYEFQVTMFVSFLLFDVLLNTFLKYIHVNQMGLKKIFFFFGKVYTLFISEFLIIGVHV
jgi:hypothetical protein